jgi:hypothetical protein
MWENNSGICATFLLKSFLLLIIYFLCQRFPFQVQWLLDDVSILNRR